MIGTGIHYGNSTSRSLFVKLSKFFQNWGHIGHSFSDLCWRSLACKISERPGTWLSFTVYVGYNKLSFSTHYKLCVILEVVYLQKLMLMIGARFTSRRWLGAVSEIVLLTWIVPFVRCIMIAFGALIHRLIWGIEDEDACRGPPFPLPPSPPSVRFSSMYCAK